MRVARSKMATQRLRVHRLGPGVTSGAGMLFEQAYNPKVTLNEAKP